MRIAILSDIHSNLQALIRALSVIDELRVDRVFCLGDIVGYGGNPNECLTLIRKRASQCVLGNHDLAAVDTSHAQYFTRDGRIAAEWTHEILTKENSEFLSNLPYTFESNGLTLVHASPSEPERWNYILSLEEARPQFEHFKTRVCFIGHTHVPFICGEDLKTFTVTQKGRFLINVGSVGQPRDGNPQLSFGIFDTDQWTYENIRADYDIPGAADAIIENGLPPPLAQRLFNGL